MPYASRFGHVNRVTSRIIVGPAAGYALMSTRNPAEQLTMNHNSFGYCLFAICGVLALDSQNATAFGTETLPAIATVASVDLTRYAGRWYEITRIPNRFQRACASDTTADYAIRDDGRLDVINRCLREDGRPDEASGVAKIVDTQSNAKLKVSFVSFFGWRPFWGDYWVIGLDENYQWAIVGHPSRKYGWILARTPELDDETLSRIFSIIERNGYQRSTFEMTAHRIDPAGD
jgi:apolipoprotein D and lipocalin family protein